MLPADTGHVSETDSATEDDYHDSIAKMEKSKAAKRSTRRQILGWLGVQQQDDKKGEDEESDDDAVWHRNHGRYRDRYAVHIRLAPKPLFLEADCYNLPSSPVPSTSALSSLKSSAEDDSRQRRDLGRLGLASRFKNAIRCSQGRRRPRLAKSPSESTSSLDSDASFSSAARTTSARSAVNRDSRQRPSRLRTWPFRSRQSQKANRSDNSFDFYASEGSD